MKRRQFLQMAVPAVAARWAFVEPDLRYVLRGGRWFAQGRWQTGEIGVDHAGRLRLGTGLRAPVELDIANRVVSPGFIDILADNGSDPAATCAVFERYKVSDGVTSALQMHGGTADCRTYYKTLGALPHAINFGASTFVMAIRNRTASLAKRLRLVERNLEEGALGVSHSIEYQPAPFEELLQYARLARKFDRPFFLHLRYSSAERELDGVDEAIRLARASGARTHIAHLHSTGGTFRMAEALEKIRDAIREGVALTTCVYPYTYWATYLSSRRFDTGWQQRFGLTYSDLRVVGTGERLTAASFRKYRATPVLVSVPEGTMPFSTTVDLAMAEDFCLIGSDGGILRERRANSHPRGAGCFSTAIRYALDRGMPLETMLAKMTTMPRAVVTSIGPRGTLTEGAVADLVVFDPATIGGRATVENPNQFSAGIELVLVGGRIAYEPGRVGGRFGSAIRAGAAPALISE